MESITKTKMSDGQVLALAQEAFGLQTELLSIQELTDGYFNSAYRVVLQDGRSAVLKISPKKEIQVMRYEAGLMAVEAAVLEQVSKIPGVPAPELLYRKQETSFFENDYFFMAFVPGEPLDKFRQSLDDAQADAIASNLGEIAKRVNQVTGDHFGYIARPDMQFGSWREAFLTMIQELLDDAADVEVSLPFSYTDVYHMIESFGNVLDTVEKPSLLHKDLWAGNIFVDPETLEITGLVDFERAIYGDALMEPVCGFLLENDAFMKVYWSRSTLTRDEQIRTTLYKIYLFLIMVIECSYRHYGDNGQEKWARSQLDENFATLTSFS